MKKTDTSVCVNIGGMTCPSCELLLERKLKTVPGVQSADVSYKSGVGRIVTKAGNAPDMQEIAAVIEQAGYTLLEDGSVYASMPGDTRKWLQIGVSLIIILALYMLLQTFDIVSLAPSTSGALSLGGIFLIGLVAGTSSCLAVTGGLLLALAAKHNELHRSETPAQKFQPLLQFNLGRLAGYFVFGGLIGLLGQSITLSTRMTGYVNIAVAVVMLFLALSMLDIVSKGRFPIRVPKTFTRKIAALADSDHPAAPFALGALTFFLPCGFTQSLQLVALASGSFSSGATIMLLFALGTLPALLGISMLSSSMKGTMFSMFLRFSGTLVLILALFNLNSGLALTGINLPFAPATTAQPAAPTMKGNVQEVSIVVTPYGTYEPNVVTINAGVPVRWKIDGTNAFGCTSIMTIPALNISQPLHAGENIIEFTAPAEPGQLAFMCSMGMVRGTFKVI